MILTGYLSKRPYNQYRFSNIRNLNTLDVLKFYWRSSWHYYWSSHVTNLFDQTVGLDFYPAFFICKAASA